MRITIVIRTMIPKRDRDPRCTAIAHRSDTPYQRQPRIVMPIRPKPGKSMDTVMASLLGLQSLEIEGPDDFFDRPEDHTHAVILGAIRAAVAERKRRQSVA